jgi:dihydropyrimidinase
VLPGAIDVHTHFEMPFMGTYTADDFRTGTSAAAAGGVTTVVDWCIQQPGESLFTALETWDRKAAGKAVIDYSFHVVLTDISRHALDEIRDVVRNGIASFKCFMAYKGTPLMQTDGNLFRIMQRVRDAGALFCVHAENGDIIDVLVQQYVAEGKLAPMYHAHTRPPEVEAEATARAIALAELAHCPLLMVHLSAKEALQKVREARDRGLAIHAETCPHYLSLHYEELERPNFEGAKFVCSPPLRHRENTPHLWAGLREENLQEISSDHCAFNWKLQKEQGRDSFANIPNGLAGIETMIPVVFSEGVRTGLLPLNRFVRVTSTNAARLFGLYPEKGTIAVGSDADLVVFDPERRVTITKELLHQNVDHTPYEGFSVTGWPAVTLSRGEVVFENGTVVGRPGRGRFVKRKATVSV